jgi:predicted phage terminase large subunit-like protein
MSIPLGDLTIDEDLLKQALASAPLSERAKLISLIEELKRRQAREFAQQNFLAFVQQVWPSFIYGRHHARMAQEFEKVVSGENKRLIINLGPRHTKSEFGSYLLPAWYLGKNPDKKIIQCSHTAELAVGFGRKVRNLVGSAAYQEIFPGVELQQDSKAAGRWNTSAGGSYFAIGVSGAVTGIGGDIIIIDDPHSEQEAAIAASNPEIYDKVYEWYTSGPRQRLQPGGSVILIQTRWSKRDLSGQVKQKELEGGGDKWKVVELPAILPSGKPLWPEFWSIEELEATRNAIDVSKWQAQYQQNPTSEEGAIVKRDWWQKWETDTPPPTSFILQAWDTAFEKHNRADYSACTTWGIFNLPDENGIDRANIILLDAKRDRLEFPQLKEKVLSEYRYWEPDVLLIEKKASGAPLIYELRHMGISVSDFTPTRGNDKISRLNAISDIFASGRVWAPSTRWADEVIEEVAAFPAGQHDDYCFVAGTKILMSDGFEKNIEDVAVGDEVWSHLGAKKVLASGCTGEVKTETLQTGNNLEVLEGTGGHLIYSNNEWKKLTNLNRKDNIVKVSINKEKLCQQNLLEQIDYHLNLMGQPTKNITTDLIGKKLEGESFYTEMYGNITTEKYLKVIMCIILMVTKTTMMSPIFKLCPQNNIGKSIEKRKAFEEKLKSDLSILKKLDLYQQNGMVQKKVAHGMLSMLKKYLEIQIGLNRIVKLFQWKKLALFVEQSSYLKTQQDKNIAQTNAQAKLYMIKNVLKYWLQAPQIVSNVVKRYTQSIVSKDFAMEHVAVLLVEQKENLKKVYNITVEDSHTYFANGILVHNCDTVSMSMMRFRQGGFISTALDREDEAPDYRRKTSSSYY